MDNRPNISGPFIPLVACYEQAQLLSSHLSMSETPPCNGLPPQPQVYSPIPGYYPYPGNHTFGQLGPSQTQQSWMDDKVHDHLSRRFLDDINSPKRLDSSSSWEKKMRSRGEKRKSEEDSRSRERDHNRGRHQSKERERIGGKDTYSKDRERSSENEIDSGRNGVTDRDGRTSKEKGREGARSNQEERENRSSKEGGRTMEKERKARSKAKDRRITRYGSPAGETSIYDDDYLSRHGMVWKSTNDKEESDKRIREKDKNVKMAEKESSNSRKEMPEMCPNGCNEYTETDSVLHMEHNHSDFLFKCTNNNKKVKCGKLFWKVSQLRSHIKRHSNSHGYTEDRKEDMTNARLALDNRILYPVDLKEFRCQICRDNNIHFSSFLSSVAINHVRNTHHICTTPESSITYKCRECRLDFTKEKNLELHIDTEHKQALDHSNKTRLPTSPIKEDLDSGLVNRLPAAPTAPVIPVLVKIESDSDIEVLDEIQTNHNGSNKASQSHVDKPLWERHSHYYLDPIPSSSSNHTTSEKEWPCYFCEEPITDSGESQHLKTHYNWLFRCRVQEGERECRMGFEDYNTAQEHVNYEHKKDSRDMIRLPEEKFLMVFKIDHKKFIGDVGVKNLSQHVHGKREGDVLMYCRVCEDRQIFDSEDVGKLVAHIRKRHPECEKTSTLPRSVRREKNSPLSQQVRRETISPVPRPVTREVSPWEQPVRRETISPLPQSDRREKISPLLQSVRRENISPRPDMRGADYSGEDFRTVRRVEISGEDIRTVRRVEISGEDFRTVRREKMSPVPQPDRREKISPLLQPVRGENISPLPRPGFCLDLRGAGDSDEEFHTENSVERKRYKTYSTKEKTKNESHKHVGGEKRREDRSKSNPRQRTQEKSKKHSKETDSSSSSSSEETPRTHSPEKRKDKTKPRFNKNNSAEEILVNLVEEQLKTTRSRKNTNTGSSTSDTGSTSDNDMNVREKGAKRDQRKKAKKSSPHKRKRSKSSSSSTESDVDVREKGAERHKRKKAKSSSLQKRQRTESSSSSSTDSDVDLRENGSKRHQRKKAKESSSSTDSDVNVRGKKSKSSPGETNTKCISSKQKEKVKIGRIMQKLQKKDTKEQMKEKETLLKEPVENSMFASPEKPKITVSSKNDQGRGKISEAEGKQNPPEKEGLEDEESTPSSQLPNKIGESALSSKLPILSAASFFYEQIPNQESPTVKPIQKKKNKSQLQKVFPQISEKRIIEGLSCAFCEERFIAEPEMRQHIFDYHSTMLFHCKKCKSILSGSILSGTEGFLTTRELLDHLKEKHGVKEVPVKTLQNEKLVELPENSLHKIVCIRDDCATKTEFGSTGVWLGRDITEVKGRIVQHNLEEHKSPDVGDHIELRCRICKNSRMPFKSPAHQEKWKRHCADNHYKIQSLQSKLDKNQRKKKAKQK